jgi:hypothetical protein
MNTCGYSPYVTFSATRGWVCRLQLLLILASAVILRSESRENHDHILLSQIRDSPNLEGQVSVFISPRNTVVRLYPQALGSPCVTSYGSVEVFDPTSTRDTHWVAPVIFKITPQHGPIESIPVSIVVVHLLQLPSNGLHNTVFNANSIVEVCLPRRCVVTVVVSFLSRYLPSNGSILHNILPFTCRWPVSMNILATKMGALNIAPKHKTGIFSKTTPTILIQFWRPSP